MKNLDKIIHRFAQTASKSAHEKTFVDLPSTEPAISSKASTHASQSTSCCPVQEIDIFSTTARPVPLFVVKPIIRSTLGVVKIQILSLRSPSDFTCRPERPFTVTVDFWPLPKWNCMVSPSCSLLDATHMTITIFAQVFTLSEFGPRPILYGR